MGFSLFALDYLQPGLPLLLQSLVRCGFALFMYGVA